MSFDAIWQQVNQRRQRMPAYRLTLAGKDITSRLQGRLMSLTLTDNRGLEADQLDITLDDTKGDLDIPSKGVKLDLAIGWAGMALVEKGSFTIDEVSHTGAPDQITIRGRSANLSAGLRVKRDKSWPKTTLGAIAQAIAKNADLILAISPALKSRAVAHIDQTGESDLNLLTRLCKDHGAVASVKAGRLLVFEAGKASTASGEIILPVVITRADGDSHEYASSDRDAYAGVKAQWVETRTGKRHDVIVGDEENVKLLRHTYANETDALLAAQAELARIQRATASFNLTLAIGRPDLYPETPIIVVGFKPVIDGGAWIATKLTHNIGNGGYTTKLDCEVLGAELEAIDKNGAGITGVRAKWLVKKTGKRSSVLAGKEGNVKQLMHVYATEKAARAAADREWAKLSGKN